MTPDKNARLFVAAAVPLPLAHSVVRLVPGLAGEPVSQILRLIPIEQMHITFKFLGGVPPATIEPLTGVLAGACEGTMPFEVSVTGVGAFPSHSAPRVVWLGIARGVEPMLKLQARIDHAAAPFARHKEHRAFHPHITIGRARPGPKPAFKPLKKILDENHAVEFGGWLIDRILLMESQLSPRGAQYRVVKTIRL
jgi:2'-5' RNA ligase